MFRVKVGFRIDLPGLDPPSDDLNSRFIGGIERALFGRSLVKLAQSACQTRDKPGRIEPQLGRSRVHAGQGSG